MKEEITALRSEVTAARPSTTHSDYVLEQENEDKNTM